MGRGLFKGVVRPAKAGVRGYFLRAGIFGEKMGVRREMGDGCLRESIFILIGHENESPMSKIKRDFCGRINPDCRKQILTFSGWVFFFLVLKPQGYFIGIYISRSISKS